MKNRPFLWIRNVKSRLAQHVKSKTAECATTRIHATNPIEAYGSAQRDQVAIRAVPFLVAPSCLLPASHATATVDPTTQTSIFVHRDASTKVRAYLNQCRHRGARLLPPNSKVEPGLFSTTPIRGSALVCPYHAWTYDVTTGALKGVPGEKIGFPCLDKSQHGLAHVDCFEAAGGIWLGKRNDSSFLTSGWPSIDAELSSLLPPPPPSSLSSSHQSNDNFVGYHEWHLNANWQILVETFLEAYHVNYLHKHTLGLVAHSNIMVTDVLDAYSLRMTVPLKNFDTNPKLHDTDDDYDVDTDELESFLSQTTTTYFLFPNTAISLFKRFIVFLSIVPADSATTSNLPSCKSHVRAFAIARKRSSSNTNNDDGDAATMVLARRDYESVISGIEEDWECAEGIQSGLMAARANNKSNSTFSHGCFEGNNVAFLRHVGLVSQELLKDRQIKDK